MHHNVQLINMEMYYCLLDAGV